MLDRSAGVSLKQRVLGAGAWSVGGYALNQVLRFASNLLMTRLLAPDMYGVTAIASVILSGLAMFSDLGVRSVIIRSGRGHDPVFLNTAWALQIVRGMMIWAVAASIALLLLFVQHGDMIPKNSVYADSRLPYVILVISFAAAIEGFISTKVYEAGRNLMLRRITMLELAAQITGLLLMLGWVAIDRSIWTLVVGALGASLTRTVLSHACMHGTPNRWQWQESALREIVHFGKWILLASVLGFLAINSDRLLLGGMVDATVLGVYVIAFLVFSSVEQVTTRLIADVSLPALSEVARERLKDLKASYYRLHAVIGMMAYACSGLLMVSGHALVLLIYDPRYYEAGWMLQILAAALMTVPCRVAGPCFLALGISRYVSRFAAIRLISLVVAMLIGFYFFALPGAVWGISVSYFSSWPAIAYYQVRHGIFDLRKELRSLTFVPIGMAAGVVLNTLIARFAN